MYVCMSHDLSGLSIWLNCQIWETSTTPVYTLRKRLARLYLCTTLNLAFDVLPDHLECRRKVPLFRPHPLYV